MNGRAIIGLVLLAAGVFIWFTTPSNVTWGNHHYLKHFVQYGLIAAGALFLIVGARRS